MVATTNRIEDLDEAFFRRFDDYAVLPIPDAPTRQSLWRKIMGEHAGVDYDLLGNNFAISGGLIKGAAIRARAWAYGLDKPVTTPFALAALVRQLEKNNRNSKEAKVPQYRRQINILLDGGDLSKLDRISKNTTIECAYRLLISRNQIQVLIEFTHSQHSERSMLIFTLFMQASQATEYCTEGNAEQREACLRSKLPNRTSQSYTSTN